MAEMTIHERLLAAQESVEAVVKRGINEQQRYTYATAADVIAVCRAALHDAGLFAVTTATRVAERRGYETKSKAQGLYVEVAVELRIMDGEGNRLVFTAAGAGADLGGGDKAILKAQTAATKYAYAAALALPFADFEPEKDVQGSPGRLPEQKADPDKALPEERVEAIGRLVKESRIGFDRLCVVFGSMGANAPKLKRKDSIRKAVAELTDAQATQLENLLDAEATGG